MRKLVLQMQVSADGYVGAPDGDVAWAFPQFDDEFKAWAVETLWNAGLHVMGGETGRGLAAYWPRPDIDERDKPYQAAMNEIPKVVFSKTIDQLDWNQTTIVRGGLSAEIAKLKQQDGKLILVHGGARFAQSLSRERLVDEYHLVVHPVVLGRGLAIFPEFDRPLKLELIDLKRFPAGAVLHVYRPS